MTDYDPDAVASAGERGSPSDEPRLGLWIRVSAALANDADVRALARHLFAPAERNGTNSTLSHDSSADVPAWLAVAATEGFLVNVWSQVAEHREDGVIADVDDDLLEQWARWRGEPGRFAGAFVERFVSAGKINRWDEFNIVA
jgi:hypothetical protein